MYVGMRIVTSTMSTLEIFELEVLEPSCDPNRRQLFASLLMLAFSSESRKLKRMGYTNEYKRK